MSDRIHATHLIDEPPILVYPTLAVILGINQAVIFQQLHFLLGITEKAKNHYNFVNDRWWVYNSYAEWKASYFPWLAAGSIKRFFLELEELRLVDSMQSVKTPSDRRKWYTINYPAWEQFVLTIGTNCADGGWEQIVPMVGTKCADGYSENTAETTTENTTKAANAALSPFDEMKNAIRDTFQWPVPTKEEWGKIQKAAKSLIDSEVPPSLVPALYAECKRRGYKSFSPLALPTVVSDVRRAQAVPAINEFSSETVMLKRKVKTS